MGFTDSTDLLHQGNGELLRSRADADGYLFFKRLLPPETVYQVRADILDVVEKYGWRQACQDRLGGLIDATRINLIPRDRMRLDIGVSSEAYDSVQRLESVHRLPHHPNLYALYELLFEQETLVHPRHIIRMMTPHHALTPTPPHQDFPLIQGSVKTWTCWFPVGDCPRDLGSLTVLRGSHREGCLPIYNTNGAGNIAAHLCPNETDWVSADFEAGDVLTFPSYTVHKALPNTRKEQIRLSMDVRYQAMDDIIEEKSLLPHCGLSWEEIYHDWDDDDLKYYWRRQTMAYSAWNPGLMQPGRRIC